VRDETIYKPMLFLDVSPLSGWLLALLKLRIENRLRTDLTR